MVRWRQLSLVIFGAATLAGCSSTPQAPEEAGLDVTPAEGEVTTEAEKTPELVIDAGVVENAVTVKRASTAFAKFESVPFTELPAARSEDWTNALRAFRTSCTAMGAKPLWLESCANAQLTSDEAAYDFFARWFEAWKVTSLEDKTKPAETGLMTGYYEPMLRGSRTKHGDYQYPLYGVPDDLITVDLTSLHPQLKGLRLRGKVVGNRLVPYDTRGQIEKRGDLAGKVLCWVDDPVDAFFLQIQGSGRVLLDDGAFLRLGYADQNGHPYKAIGAWLVENAGLKREEMSMQRIRKWVRDNPQRTRELLDTNPNFVFFAERTGFSDEEGPIGAQGVPITGGATVAVDRRYWQLGVPFLTDVSQAKPAMHFVRPVIAQDTGGAIRGVIRFDYFWGYGDIAGLQAGRQKSDARCWVLVPRGKTPADVTVK